MSRYLISDIHGDFSRFQKMLEKIHFNSQNDVLYILGDVLDRGRENLALFEFVNNCESMHLIKGNHELFAQMYLEGKLKKEKWIAWGGEYTVEEVDALGDKDKARLYEQLQALNLYIEIQVENEKWILTHSGLDADCIVEKEGKVIATESIEAAAKINEFKLMISNDIHYMPTTKLKTLDKFVVVGHTPVIRLNEDGSYRIIHEANYMCIDSGAGHRKQGGKMSCYCIETQQEVYL